MSWSVFGIGFFVLACISNTFAQKPDIEGLPSDRPVIIAHRGSSGMRPEHTVAAYQLAIEQGADVIECDLAVTKDQKLICSHDAWLNESTNVASYPQFKDRVKTYTILGTRRTDYFTIDFTLEELQTIQKIQSRSYRDQSYNGKFPLASFDDYVAVAKNITNKRIVGIYPETKIPSFFNDFLSSHNTTVEDILLDSLQKYGYTQNTSPCFIQSFSEDSITYMSTRTNLPLIFLTTVSITDSKMTELSSFCYGIGTSKETIVQADRSNSIFRTTDFIERAHEHDLKVHVYTFRNEDQFLLWNYGADPYREYEQFLKLGVDGYFTDFPWSLSHYMELLKAQNNGAATQACASPFLIMSITIIFLFFT